MVCSFVNEEGEVNQTCDREGRKNQKKGDESILGKRLSNIYVDRRLETVKVLESEKEMERRCVWKNYKGVQGIASNLLH